MGDRVRRYDAFRFDAATPTPSGGLRIDAYPTRAGVLTYRDGDGNVRRELRPPEEVFSEASLRSLRGAPVTDRHPEGAVTPETWRQLAIGHVGDQVAPHDDRVFAPILIQDANAISAISERRRGELSAGYTAIVTPESGVFDGQPYDYRQSNIEYNHVALLGPGEGRAGPRCALRLDSQDACPVQEDAMADAKIRIDGKDYDVTSAESAIAAIIAERDQAKGALAASEATSKKLKERVDGIPAEVKTEVAKRVKLLADLRRAHVHFDADGDPPDGEEVASKDPIAVMTEALTKWEPGFDVKGASPDFILGAFSLMMAKVTGEEDEEPESAPIDGTRSAEAPTMQQNGGAPRADAAARRLNRSNVQRTDAGEKDPSERNIEFQRDRATKPLAYSKQG